MKNVIGLLLLGLTVVLPERAAGETVERIAFTYCGSETCAIVVMDANGANPLAIAEGYEPAWSPDGTRLAFGKDRAIAVLTLADGTVVSLTSPPPGSYDSSPAWSPDGSKIAFARGNSVIYVMNVDGTDLARLPTGDGSSADAPAWSPDGSKITFTCGGGDLCQVDADGTGLIALTAGSDAAWAPDGSKIAFSGSFYFSSYFDWDCECYIGGYYSDIGVVNPDGTGVTPLTVELNAYGPTWSPDGGRIAFTADDCIWVMNSDGTGVECLVRPHSFNPAWMPVMLTRLSAPPVIDAPTTSATVGNAIAVTATITDDLGVSGATLAYRRPGGDYTIVPLEASGSTYAGTIPAPAAGVEYYLEAHDADGNVTRMPFAAPFIPSQIPSATLRVLRAGVGTGTVTSNPPGIACPPTCAAVFARDTTVAVTAVADTAFGFAGWSGAGCNGTGSCNVALLGDTNVTAIFQGRFTVTVAKGGDGSGRVTSASPGIDCGSDCSEQYLGDTSVTLTATPDPGSTFLGWSGVPCNDTAPCTFLVTTADVAVTANFQALPRRTLRVLKTGTGRGRVTSTPAGIDCGTDCSEPFAVGTAVTLVATPEPGHTFTGWSTGSWIPGNCIGTPTCTVTVNRNTGVTARFDVFTLRVQKTGGGRGRVTSAPGGIDCGADCSEHYAAGTAVTLVATPEPGHTFVNWSGGGCPRTETCTVTVSGNTVVTARFDVFTLRVQKTGGGRGRVTSAPVGIDCGADCSQPYAKGTTVTLTATAEAGHTFAGWSGGGCSRTETETCTVTVTGNTVVAARFDVFTLRVQKTGGGRGRVTSAPVGIDCGADCSQPYAKGATVTLTATAEAGHTFTGWNGAGCSRAETETCTVTVTGNMLVTARFDVFTLHVQKTGGGRGRVTSAPGGIDCGADCAEPYVKGTAVALTAVPEPGHTFMGWHGSGCSGTGPCNVTVNASVAVTAQFDVFTLHVQKSGGGRGVVTTSLPGIDCGTDCSEPYVKGTTVTLTATPDPGHTFVGWNGGGCRGVAGPCTTTINNSVTITAQFTVLTLRVTRTGTARGRVTSAPSGIDCGTDCTEAYTSGTTVTLTATPEAGEEFAGWSGGGCTGTGPCTVTVVASVTVSARFVKAITARPSDIVMGRASWPRER